MEYTRLSQNSSTNRCVSLITKDIVESQAPVAQPLQIVRLKSECCPEIIHDRARVMAWWSTRQESLPPSCPLHHPNQM
jgi:hypothetical protein